MLTSLYPIDFVFIVLYTCLFINASTNMKSTFDINFLDRSNKFRTRVIN